MIRVLVIEQLTPDRPGRIVGEIRDVDQVARVVRVLRREQTVEMDRIERVAQGREFHDDPTAILN